MGGGVSVQFSGGGQVLNSSMALTHAHVCGNSAGSGGGGVYLVAVPGCLSCPCFVTATLTNSSVVHNRAGACWRECWV